VSDNSAGGETGGGIYVNSTNPKLYNVTLVNNSADNGGGIYGTSSGKATLINCILYNNSPNEIVGPAEISYSDIAGGWQGEGNIDADPLFTGDDNHPYQLGDGSPCIDAGRPDISGLFLPEYDLIGNYRLWDGDMDGDTIVDMGAYEFGSVGVGTPAFRVLGSGFRVDVFPNPTSERVHLEFEIRNPSPVSIQVMNAVGERVAALADGVQMKGRQKLTWNAGKLPSGLYFCKVQAGEEVIVVKLIKH
jgi:predicted outer membrane repeat protein